MLPDRGIPAVETASRHIPSSVRSDGPPRAVAAAAGRARGRWDLLVLGLVVVAGAGVRFWGLGFGLPHTQARPDETQVMDVALHYLRGELWPAFYDYPRLYNYALVVLYLAYLAVGWIAGWFGSVADLVASWPVHWEPFFLINRGLSAACGTLTVAVVWSVGRDLGGRAVGLAAALSMAFAFLHVRDSHYGTMDAAMTLLVVLAVRQLLRSDLGAWNRHDAAAAVVAGLAAGTKYNAVFLLVPLAVSHVLHVLDGGAPRLRRLFDGRAAVVAVGFTLAFLACVPFVLFDHARFAVDMRHLTGSMRAGVGSAPIENGWWYHLNVSLRHGLGLPLLVAALAGLPLVIRGNWRRGIVFLAFPVAYYGVAGGVSNRFARYAIPLVPFLCVSAGVFVVWAAGVMAGPAGRSRRLLIGGLTAAILVLPAWKVVTFDTLLARSDSRVLVAQWIERHAAPGETIAQSGSPYGYAQVHPDTTLKSWAWHRRRRVFMYQLEPVEGKPDWIVLQESPIPSTTQPVVTEWLRRDYHLAAVFRAYDATVKDNLYERQDAFYLPFGAFRGVQRPGPNFLVFKHTDAATATDDAQ